MSFEKKEQWAWKKSTNLLLGLRSNVHHFWEWARENRGLFPAGLLDFEGWVLGDAHLYNFAEIKLKDGSYKWSFVDLDDSGIGPFAVDMLRNVSTVVAGNYKKVDFKDIYEAYLDGVRGKEYTKPDIVKYLRDLKTKDAEDQKEDFIDKIIDTETGKFNYGVKSTVSFAEGPKDMQKFVIEHLAQFQEVLPENSSISDKAFRTKEEGGSQGLVRVFFSVIEGKEYEIFEFKPLVRPALDYFQDQLTQQERINGIMKFLWENSVPEDYRYIKIADKEFFMRIRLPKLFAFHDEEEFLALNKEDQREYLLYIGNWMGKKHSKQMDEASIEAYAAQLKDKETFAKLNELLTIYLNLALKQNSSKP